MFIVLTIENYSDLFSEAEDNKTMIKELMVMYYNWSFFSCIMYYRLNHSSRQE